MLMLLQHAVKHLTPLWQRNLNLLSPVSLTGITLSLSLFLCGSTSISTAFISFFLSFMPPSLAFCLFIPHSQFGSLCPAENFPMLLYEQLDAFMVRPKDCPEPVERFIKRHFSRPADEVVGVGDDFFFHRHRQVIFLRQSQPGRLRCGYAGPDMTFDDITERR